MDWMSVDEMTAKVPLPRGYRSELLRRSEIDRTCESLVFGCQRRRRERPQRRAGKFICPAVSYFAMDFRFTSVKANRIVNREPMDKPLDLVRLAPLLKRFSGASHLTIDIVYGLAVMNHPDFRTARSRDFRQLKYRLCSGQRSPGPEAGDINLLSTGCVARNNVTS